MKKKMLLHSCCGPCSTACIDRLKDDYDLTVFYYNPNIFPQEEYLHRLNEQIRYVKEAGLKICVIDGKYDDNQAFYQAFSGLENEKEGGARCSVCFALRLDKTAKFAKENGYDIFATTLSVSPHKNAQLINEIGQNLSKKYEIEYLVSDFKKKDGYLISIRKSKEYNLYRQNYCGCKYSIYEKKV
jgi:epoxyqueuosine reductase